MAGKKQTDTLRDRKRQCWVSSPTCTGEPQTQLPFPKAAALHTCRNEADVVAVAMLSARRQSHLRNCWLSPADSNVPSPSATKVYEFEINEQREEGKVSAGAHKDTNTDTQTHRHTHIDTQTHTHANQHFLLPHTCRSVRRPCASGQLRISRADAVFGGGVVMISTAARAAACSSLMFEKVLSAVLNSEDVAGVFDTSLGLRDSRFVAFPLFVSGLSPCSLSCCWFAPDASNTDQKCSVPPSLLANKRVSSQGLRFEAPPEAELPVAGGLMPGRQITERTRPGAMLEGGTISRAADASAFTDHLHDQRRL